MLYCGWKIKGGFCFASRYSLAPEGDIEPDPGINQRRSLDFNAMRLIYPSRQSDLKILGL